MNAEELFHAVLEKPAAERAAFLTEACTGNPPLRHLVDALLHAHDNPSDFLAVDQQLATIAETAEGTAPENAGRLLAGKYQLLEPIGEGGMGSVWMARQLEPVKRLVAVKLIKVGMDSKAVLARFEQERQALALMDHPNIAKVFDAGMVTSCQLPVASENKAGGQPLATGNWQLATAATPYFVMELIQGIPITKYCDEHRLTPRQRLELFLPVCHAIQHAHQKGIIHRDVKPSNVLIAVYDDRPTPKVIDFGVAKATGRQLMEETLQTGFGTVIGTLEYMSPEQASLNQFDVDTRSDVYSLGVLLYELLTGSPPFQRKDLEKAGMLEMLRVIREQEPSKPSTKLSKLSSHHAPRDEPGLVSRSETATLASIAANRGTEPARLTRLLRNELDWIVMKALEKDRTRRYETANGLAMDVQRHLCDEAVQARPASAAYRLRKFVRRNRRGVAMAGALGLAVLLMAASFGWAWRDREAQQSMLNDGVAAALDEAGQLDERALALTDNPQQWEATAAAALSALKRAQSLAASAADRLKPELAERLQELTTRLDGNEKDRLLVALGEQIRLDQSEVQVEENRFEVAEAGPKYRRAFVTNGLDPSTISAEKGAVLVAAKQPTVRAALVIMLGEWLRSGADNDREWLRELLTAADPDTWRNQMRDAIRAGHRPTLEALAQRPELAKQPPAACALLANVLNRHGARASALDVLQGAQERYPSDFWVNHDLALTLKEAEGRQAREAIAYYRAALALRPRCAGVYFNIGMAMMDAGDQAAAQAAFHKAIELRDDYAHAYNSLGQCLERAPDWPAAKAAYVRAIAIKPDYAGAHYNLGRAFAAESDLASAKASYERSLACNPRYAPAHNNLGLVLEKLGDLPGAAAALEKAIELQSNYVIAHLNLSRLLQKKRNFAGAERHSRQAIAIDPERAEGHNDLGNVLGAQGDLDGAQAAHEKAIALKPEDPNYQFNLGTVLVNKGESARGAAVLRRAIALKPEHALAYVNLGSALLNQNDVDGALAALEKAMALDPAIAEAHCLQGNAFLAKGKFRGALAAYDKAIALAPDHPRAHNNRGQTLFRLGDPTAAIASLRRAVALTPDSAPARCNLGLYLQDQGEFAEALLELKRGHELGSRRKGWKNPSARWVQECERLVELEGKLPAVLCGEASPQDNSEALEFARVCGMKRLHLHAATLYERALAAQPEIADDLKQGHRYVAARMAALAAFGSQDESSRLSDEQRRHWRQQALDWLRADLALWTKQEKDATAQARNVIRQRLLPWRSDAAFRNLRDGDALAKLPESEPEAWQRFWNDVQILLDKLSGTQTP